MTFTFCNWDWRPAVITPGGLAFAVLAPNQPWSAVDFCDVSHTASVMSEAEWREYFKPKFGPLDLSAIPVGV